MVSPSEYTETSRVIFSGPCVVKSVHVANSHGSAAGECKVYDGVNSNGKLKAYLLATFFSSYTWRPDTDFNFGIYIAVNASTTRVTVTFEPISPKKSN